MLSYLRNDTCRYFVKEVEGIRKNKRKERTRKNNNKHTRVSNHHTSNKNIKMESTTSPVSTPPHHPQGMVDLTVEDPNMFWIKHEYNHTIHPEWESIILQFPANLQISNPMKTQESIFNFKNHCYPSYFSSSLADKIVSYWEFIPPGSDQFGSSILHSRWLSLLLLYCRLNENTYKLVYIRTRFLVSKTPQKLLRKLSTLSDHNKVQFMLLLETMETELIQFNIHLHLFYCASIWFHIIDREISNNTELRNTLLNSGYMEIITTVKSFTYLEEFLLQFRSFYKTLFDAITQIKHENPLLYDIHRNNCVTKTYISLSMCPDPSFFVLTSKWFVQYFHLVIDNIAKGGVFDTSINYHPACMEIVNNILDVDRILTNFQTHSNWVFLKLYSYSDYIHPIEAVKVNNELHVKYSDMNDRLVFNRNKVITSFAIKQELYGIFADSVMWTYRSSTYFYYKSLYIASRQCNASLQNAITEATNALREKENRQFERDLQILGDSITRPTHPSPGSTESYIV